ncbi:MAG: SRPBCC family protein [Acidimicrobiia bacterium]|nr:SRPBCC family protein [Acidimicrobiia bacterium]
MAIEISERFRVDAPVDVVWPFVKDPTQLVTCMPGASLDEVVDERTFVGTVKVKLGAVTTKYKGRVEFTEVDEDSRTVRVVAEGRETGGGTAKGTMSSTVVAISDDCTEIVAEGGIDLTGRVMQMGRGMIQGVSEQLFEEFAASTKRRLESVPVTPDEAGAAVSSGGTPATPPPTTAAEPEAIKALPLLWRALKKSLRRAWQRLRDRRKRRQVEEASGSRER